MRIKYARPLDNPPRGGGPMPYGGPGGGRGGPPGGYGGPGGRGPPGGYRGGYGGGRGEACGLTEGRGQRCPPQPGVASIRCTASAGAAASACIGQPPARIGTLCVSMPRTLRRLQGAARRPRPGATPATTPAATTGVTTAATTGAEALAWC